MRHSHRPARQNWLACLLLAVAAGSIGGAVYAGDPFFGRNSVGGVLIDADGILSNPTTADLRELQQAWQAGLEDIPADLDDPVDLRFVSLKGLETELAKHREQLQPLPDAVKFMAGLQRVRYVLVYPDRGDIVLAGPAEGWRIDTLGSAVGATTGRPVLLLASVARSIPPPRDSSDLSEYSGN